MTLGFNRFPTPTNKAEAFRLLAWGVLVPGLLAFTGCPETSKVIATDYDEQGNIVDTRRYVTAFPGSVDECDEEWAKKRIYHPAPKEDVVATTYFCE
jgi:hypothetical protein